VANETILKFIFETIIILLISYGFYKEKNIIKFEDKVIRKLKKLIKVVTK
jgi:hypothetical protein